MQCPITPTFVERGPAFAHNGSNGPHVSRGASPMRVIPSIAPTFLAWLAPCLAISAGPDEASRADRLRGHVEALLAPLDPAVTVAVAFRDLEAGREVLIR